MTSGLDAQCSWTAVSLSGNERFGAGMGRGTRYSGRKDRHRNDIEATSRNVNQRHQQDMGPGIGTVQERHRKRRKKKAGTT